MTRCYPLFMATYLALTCLTSLACMAGSLSLELKETQLSMTANGQVLIDFIPEPEGRVQFVIDEPLSIDVLNDSGEKKTYTAPYASVSKIEDSLQAKGQVMTEAGSVFEVTDIYTRIAPTDEFNIARQVDVLETSADDVGFLSRFQVARIGGRALLDQELFIPGICYQKNEHVPPHSLAADFSEEDIIVREDRLPIPLVMVRDPVDGVTVSLVHADPDGTSIIEDLNDTRIIDEDLQFASLGVQGQASPALTLLYPGSEGSRTYARPNRHLLKTDVWSERYHPVEADVPHSYEIRLSFDTYETFPEALKATWRRAYEYLYVPTTEADILAHYEAGIGLLKNTTNQYNGYTGIPFRLKLPEGELAGNHDVSFQMGFVGQQLPIAFHLIRYGLIHQDEESIQKGEDIVAFWVSESLNKGLPKTWFSPYPSPHWKSYNTFLRIASDGMLGALRAWDIMQANGYDRPHWLEYCRSFGDWLVQNQNQDGSWSREYHWDGTSANPSKHNTSHPIPFLLALAQATGNTKYRDSALRAGEYIWQHVHETFTYVGGTPDQPNIIDREAGFMALHAFLALHDETGEARWIEAASQAADFMETWAYGWNIPIPDDAPDVTLPEDALTTGFSIIGIGHSGADLLLAGASMFYYRLYLKTGDTHYAAVARQFLHDTKHSVNLDGSLGYGQSGLCTEVLLVSPPRGWTINHWLPWLTYYMIDPIAGLQDAYQSMDIPIVEGEDYQKLKEKDFFYGSSHGLQSIAKESSLNP